MDFLEKFLKEKFSWKPCPKPVVPFNDYKENKHNNAGNSNNRRKISYKNRIKDKENKQTNKNVNKNKSCKISYNWF